MRKFIDCREMPSEARCTVAISADNDEELVEAVVQHAITVHKEKDTPELRDSIRKGMHEGSPPA